MGNYLCKVDAKGKKLADGNVVHLYHYAYKPSWNDWRWNDKMYARKLGPAGRAWGKKPDADCRDVLIAAALGDGEPVYRMKYCSGAMNDGALGWADGHVVVGKLRKAGRGWRMESNAKVMDDVVANKTAFMNMVDLMNAGGNYRPSLDMRQPDLVELANYYDQKQAERGDPRRAYRYGGA